MPSCQGITEVSLINNNEPEGKEKLIQFMQNKVKSTFNCVI